MTREIDLTSCTEEELWHHVASHLEASDIPVVLVGGAVVAVYTDGAYHSGDLDFVPEALLGNEVEARMAELGFRRVAGHFEHPDCPHLFVEFVPGPLGIGDDVRIVPRRETVDGHELKILSATDCVRDRLASYIHFEARERLDQAVLVASAHPVDWDKIRTWCEAEGRGGVEAFQDLKRLAGSG